MGIHTCSCLLTNSNWNRIQHDITNTRDSTTMASSWHLWRIQNRSESEIVWYKPSWQIFITNGAPHMIFPPSNQCLLQPGSAHISYWRAPQPAHPPSNCQAGNLPAATRSASQGHEWTHVLEAPHIKGSAHDKPTNTLHMQALISLVRWFSSYLVFCFFAVSDKQHFVFGHINCC